MTELFFAAQKATQWLTSRIQNDGSIEGAPRDLAAYYKAPVLLSAMGELQAAHRLLNFVGCQFFQLDGDFRTSRESRSAHPCFEEFPSYPSGWLVSGAHGRSRFDLSLPGWRQLTRYFDPELQNFILKLHGPKIQDVITSAHLGLLSLTMNDLGKAEAAGEFLATAGPLLARQSEFLLRMDKQGSPVESFTDDTAYFHAVRYNDDNQPYFMLGYPVAFLCKLWRTTDNERYLNGARAYVDALLACKGDLRNNLLSHKAAWGAMSYAKVTGDVEVLRLGEDILESILSAQNPDGSWWLLSDPLQQIDQTVELAIWLRTIDLFADFVLQKR